MLEINSKLTEAKEWLCNKCQISNRAKIFLFGLETNFELNNIIQSDSLKILENLPSYEVFSKVSGHI